jgi:hypothetical protein
MDLKELEQQRKRQRIGSRLPPARCSSSAVSVQSARSSSASRSRTIGRRYVNGITAPPPVQVAAGDTFLNDRPTPVPARTWESVTFVPLPTASIRPSKRSAPPPVATIRSSRTTSRSSSRLAASPAGRRRGRPGPATRAGDVGRLHRRLLRTHRQQPRVNRPRAPRSPAAPSAGRTKSPRRTAPQGRVEREEHRRHHRRPAAGRRQAGGVPALRVRSMPGRPNPLHCTRTRVQRCRRRPAPQQHRRRPHPGQGQPTTHRDTRRRPFRGRLRPRARRDADQPASHVWNTERSAPGQQRSVEALQPAMNPEHGASNG